MPDPSTQRLQESLIAFGLLEPPAIDIWDGHAQAAVQLLGQIAGLAVHDVAKAREALAVAIARAEVSRRHAARFLIPATASPALLAMLNPPAMRRFLSATLTVLDTPPADPVAVSLTPALTARISADPPTLSRPHCRHVSVWFSLAYPTRHDVDACWNPHTLSWALSN